MLRWRSVLVLVVWLTLLAVGRSVAQAATYAVTISNTQFSPAALQISVGDQISFFNSTTATQSAVTTNTSGFNTGNIGAGQTKVVIVSSPGTFSYTSAYNPALAGTVTVSSTSTSIIATPTPSTTTTTVDSTQPQPVSGTAEIMLTLTAAGLALLGLGLYTARHGTVVGNNPVVHLPLISAAEVQPHERLDH